MRAVDGISLRVRRGETFAIVGESGCGKSTLARLVTRLLDPTRGSVLFEGEDATGISGKRLTAFRRDVQFVFRRVRPGGSRHRSIDADAKTVSLRVRAQLTGDLRFRDRLTGTRPEA